MNNIIKDLFKALGTSKLSAAESITGGTFSSIITSISGSSNYFKGSVVSYSTDAKKNILNITTSKGVVNNFTAEAMAKSVKDMFKTNVSISFTGNAGPETMENGKVGETYIGICIGQKTWTFKFNSTSKKREEIIMETVAFGVIKLIEKLNS